MNKLTIIIILAFTLLGCQESLDKTHPLYTESTPIKTDEHQSIPLTQLYVALPESTTYNEQSRSYWLGKKEYIKFSKTPLVGWDDIKSDISVKDIIPIYGFEGTYYEFRDSNWIDVVVQFGEDDFFYRITAKTPNGQKGLERIRSILKTVVYDSEHEIDELEMASFSFDTDIFNYNFINVYNEAYVYAKDGGMLMLKFEEDRSEDEMVELMKDRISKELERGLMLKDQEIKKEQVNEHVAYIVQSETGYHNNKGVFCLAVLTTNNQALEISWTLDRELAGYEDKFMSILESVNFKN